MGEFGAEPGQAQQGFGEKVSGAEKVPEKVWETLVQSQVSFNRVPEKEVWCRSMSGSTGFRSGAEPRQARFWRRFRKGFGVARFNEASSRFRCDSGSVVQQISDETIVKINYCC